MYEQYTDKQIMKMLAPKLEKLGWEPEFFSSRMEKLISILYKSGYTRGQLGRSFIIGEKKTKEPATTFEVGDKVKFLGLDIEDEEALCSRRFYPPVNTVGKVVELGNDYCFVHWPEGTTADDNGTWACKNSYLKKIVEYWVPATKDNVKVGSKVRVVDKEAHNNYPCWFPVIGVVGVATESICTNCKVQWPEGATSGNDKWWCSYKWLEVLVCE